MILYLACVYVLRINAFEVYKGDVQMTTLGSTNNYNRIGCITKATNASVRIVYTKLIGVQKGSIGEFVEGSEVILQDCVIEATNTEKSPFLLAGSSLVANGIEIIAQQHGSVACFCESRDGQEELFLKDSRFDNLMCVGESSFLPVQGKGMSVVDCAFNNATKQSGFVGIPHAPGCLETHLSGSSFFDCQNVFYGGVMGGMNVYEFASSNCSFCRCVHNLQFRLSANGLLEQAIGVSYEGKTFSSTQIVEAGVSTFTDCTFSSCKGLVGGGLVIGPATAEVNSCTFESCSAAIGGGALYSSGTDSVVALKASKFIGCSATGDELLGIGPGISEGGAILINKGECFLSDVSGEGCVAGVGGFMTGLLSSEIMWVGLTINECKTTIGDGINCGGALCFSEIKSSTIKESLFQKCEAGFGGGALAILFIEKASFLHVLNCKFKENKAIGNSEKFFEALNIQAEERYEITKEMYASDILITTNETEGKFTKDNFEGTTSSSKKPRTYSRSQGNFDNLIKGALTKGGIIGLVIGIVAAVVIIVVVIIVVVCVVKKKKGKKANKSNEMVLVDSTTQEETSSEVPTE
ncbi:uncharacterized protein MONOS_10733 [Monocercomonoides exilis]|uniref:uncharacterized protein n=1 Tax=Monocercomonoides exilis TaxID=2049356 RepID=UPI0035595818|nr:hypothetical protein MONOS_10733 [Monocercomonoides exilis]|eukprot:MONOS_10733.1-p1 / transcript=MONOS_10733.1 / gene=MONOS_10733 / organism=Monocercomonoides_exilis_PA203 / gene_product=unspecified product / transcript_product=unspecified product / location=Mono_scaffold00499:20601-22340(-) / protein_length=580 / sequence_SO=supercontig / SO=protein_coding / is_pseudo=false